MSDRWSGANFRNIIDVASDLFEMEHGIAVPAETREALRKPALPHAREVARALDRREITLDFLIDSVHEILENSLPLLEQSERVAGMVSVQSVQRSMKRKCPYAFWC